MEILTHDPRLLNVLVARLEERKLIYGHGSRYSSLASNSSTLLTKEEATEIQSDLSELWALYRGWNQLYLASVRGDATDWIRRLTEHRLSPRKVRGHRLIANNGLEPHLGRVDYVSQGDDRKVAEIQWKSGGLGLFFGIQDVYAKVAPFTTGTEPLGNFPENLFRLVLSCPGAEDGVAAHGVRNHWFKGEHYLKDLATSWGLRWLPVMRDELPMRIIERAGRYFVSEAATLHPIFFFYGLEFGQIFREGFERLAQATLEGRIWVETPLNLIYRQKWGLALPFMPEFKNLFSERLREIVIPTALVRDGLLDLTPIVERMGRSDCERLLSVRSLDDIPELPGSIRKALVFKCGAGRGGLHSHGKGVFRMGGSKASARKIIELIKERMATDGEPWIVQQYVHQTYRVPVCLPEAPDRVQTIDAHARFMVFAGRYGDSAPVVMGGLGNYGPLWKVSGRSPGIDAKGNLLGTAFNDMRVGNLGEKGIRHGVS